LFGVLSIVYFGLKGYQKRELIISYAYRVGSLLTELI